MSLYGTRWSHSSPDGDDDHHSVRQNEEKNMHFTGISTREEKNLRSN